MDIVEQLARDEGLRLKPYLDITGHLTIGYGRNLKVRGISKEEADIMLANDVEDFSVELMVMLPWTRDLDRARYGVLLNMAFNMGVAGLVSFKKTLAYVEQGDYEAASLEMLDSKWAVEVGDRAHRLSEQMRTGEWK